MGSETLVAPEQPLSINEAIKRSTLPLAEAQLPPAETEQTPDWRLDIFRQSSLKSEAPGFTVQSNGDEVQITVPVPGAFTYMMRANLENLSYITTIGSSLSEGFFAPIIRPITKDMTEQQQQEVKRVVEMEGSFALKLSAQYLVRSDGMCVDINQMVQHIAKENKPPTYSVNFLPVRGEPLSEERKAMSFEIDLQNNQIASLAPATPTDIFRLFHEEGHFLRPEKEGLRGKDSVAIMAFTHSELGSQGENLDLVALVKSERDAWAYAHRMLNELRRQEFIQFEDATFFQDVQESLISYEKGKKLVKSGDWGEDTIPGVETVVTIFNNDARKNMRMRMQAPASASGFSSAPENREQTAA